MFAVVLVRLNWFGVAIDVLGDILLDPVVPRGQITVASERCLEIEEN